MHPPYDHYIITQRLIYVMLSSYVNITVFSICSLLLFRKLLLKVTFSVQLSPEQKPRHLKTLAITTILRIIVMLSIFHVLLTSAP